jgi:hypothetical protein
MVTRTITTLTDDFDGSDAEETLEFGFDDIQYEIDLSGPNADALRSVLEPYIDAGRRTGGRVARPARVKTAKATTRTTLPDVPRPLDRDDRAALRRFANENGYKAPAEKGRIGRELMMAWREAGSPR